MRLTDKIDEDGFRLVGEALERYRQQRTDARALLESERRKPVHSDEHVTPTDT